MVEPLETPDDPQPLDDRGQAVFYLSRERTRGFRDVGSGLFRTRRLSLGSTGNPFSAERRASVVTFATEILLTNDAPNRLIFQYGAGAQCLALAVDADNVLKLVCGDTSAETDDTASVQVDLSGLSGRRIRVGACVVPSAARLGLFLDGELFTAEAVNAAFPGSPAVWASADDVGAFGDDPGDLTALFDAGTATASVGVTITRLLDVYERTLPQHFGRQRVT